MNLFNEKEGMYFEAVTRLLLGASNKVDQEATITKKQIDDILNQVIGYDYDLRKEMDRVFNKSSSAQGAAPGEKKDNRKVNFFDALSNGELYKAAYKGRAITINSIIENQALKNLPKLKFADIFLSKETIKKIEEVTADIPTHWSMNDVTIKGQFWKPPLTDDKKDILRDIIKAIENKKAIRYSYSRNDKCLDDVTAYPIVIEYSMLNDEFRIWIETIDDGRIYKMNLSGITVLSIEDTPIPEGLAGHLESYLESRKKAVKLDVEPLDFIIERCFREFSYYDREAYYDPESGKYTLTVNYYVDDEKEIIKDILSFGKYVTVLEPADVRKTVIERIKKAIKVYEE